MNKFFRLCRVLILVLFPLIGYCQPVAPTANIPQSPAPSVSNFGYPLGQIFSCNSCYRNFVRVYEPQTPVTSSSLINLSSLAVATSMPITTKYVNGLGLPLQDVSNSGGSNYVDVVQLYNFEWTGMEKFKILPYAKNDLSNIGRLKYPTLQQINTFFSNAYPGDKPFSRIFQEDYAPLDRVTKIYPPGKSWIGSNRGTEFFFSGNPTYVAKWQSQTGSGSVPTFSGYYSNGDLYETKSVDEDGKTSIEYRDKQDRLIHRREAHVSGVISPYDPHKYAHTYYVYDDLGMLVSIITPEAVEQSLTGSWQTTWSITSAIYDKLCFSFAYDERGRLISKRVPGKDIEYFVYDGKDRMVFYQDGNLRAKAQWQATLYDVLNRPIATALYASSASRSVINSSVNTTSTSGTPFTLFYYIGPNSALTFRNPFSVSNTLTDAELLTRIYYDDYNYSGFSVVTYDNSLNSQLISGSTVAPIPAPSTHTHGRKTCESQRIQNPDGSLSSIWLWRIYYYDEKGREIQSQIVYPTGLEVSTKQYYFSGRLACKSTKFTKQGALQAGQQTTVVTNKYYYENRTGRLLNETQKINNGPVMYLKTLAYDDLGRLKKKTMAQSFGSGFEENYTYNIRNWLTGINPDYVDNNTTPGLFGPFFGEKISYDQGFASKLYNGNIAGIEWKGGQAGARKQFYGYTYDNLNRLTHAEYGVWSGTSWVQNATTDFNYTTTNLQYDLNGNILSMKHYGPMSSSSGTVFGVMDDLTYTYFGTSNRLASVSDAVVTNNLPKNTTPDFRDVPADFDYDYDNNGNLTKDDNKSIPSISYSLQNKPLKVLFSNGDKIEYTYNAGGEKLGKTVTSGSTTTTYEYAGNLIWKNGAIQHILHEEGRARPTNDPDKYDYDFFIKDHLKNVRTLVSTSAIAYYPPKLIPVSGVVSEDPPAPPPPGISTDPEGNVIDYLATMEVASANYEGLLWSNIDEVRDGRPLSIDPNDLSAARLNGSDENTRIGTALMLRVMPGDKFELSANNYFVAGNENNQSTTSGSELTGSLLGALVGGTVGGTPVAENQQTIEILNTTLNTGEFASFIEQMQGNSTDPTKPASHLNYVLFDENRNILPERSGALQASGSGAWLTQTVPDGILITQPGYLLVFTSAKMPKDVFWDGIHLVQYQGTAVEENHYYPFGLSLSATNPSSGVPANDIKYTSKQLERDEFGNGIGLDWYDYGARNYDPQIGRWNGVDPSADEEDQEVASPYSYVENNPVIRSDPDGKIWGNVIGALAGAVVEYGSQVAANVVSEGFTAGAFTKNIDVGDIAVSAGEGFLTSGGSVVRSAAMKVVVAVASETVRNYVDVKTTTN